MVVVVEDVDEVLAAAHVEGPCDLFESLIEGAMASRQVHDRACHQLRDEIIVLKEDAAKMKAKVEKMAGAATQVSVL